jgi:ABC-2 type transport system permease protein
MTGAVQTIHPPRTREDIPMTENQTVQRPTTRPAVRTSAASLPTLVGVEMRKSLSTRSGKSLAAAAVVLPAAAMGIAALGGGAIGAAAGPIAAMGIFAALLLLALGVLSTAGEWTHRSAQTTFLLVPQRGRVLTAKAVAVGLLGGVLAALSVVASAAVLAVSLGSALTWGGGALLAMGTVVAAGAAFAVIGAGVGAAMGNVPAALTSLYLVVLGVMPVLQTVKPAVAENLDPNGAVLSLAQGQDEPRAVGILVGWVVVSTVAGTLLTRRRQVT